MAEIIVPFTIEEDEVNTLDTVPVTLVAFGNGDTIVHVPVRLEMWREAGTAYTITGPFKTRVHKDTEAYTPGGHTAAPIWKRHELIVYDTNTHLYENRTDRDNVLFRVPAFLLLGSSAHSMVVLPESGLVLRPGNTTIKMESLVGLASGEGSIRGNLYFDERAM